MSSLQHLHFLATSIPFRALCNKSLKVLLSGRIHVANQLWSIACLQTYFQIESHKLLLKAYMTWSIDGVCTCRDEAVTPSS